MTRRMLVLVAITAMLFTTMTTLSGETAPAASPGDVLIVEVGADPASAAGIGEPAGEFLEIFNNTAATIGLENWTLDDNGSTTITFPASYSLTPGQKIVVIADSTTFGATNGYNCTTTPYYYQPSSWFSSNLHNEGDRVILRDNLDSIIDVVSYGTDTYSGTGWTGSAALDVFNNSGRTLQRAGYASGPFTDTDAASDWAGSTGAGTPCDVDAPTAVTLSNFAAHSAVPRGLGATIAIAVLALTGVAGVWLRRRR